MAVNAIASGTTSVLVLAANQYRRGFIIENSDANRAHFLMDNGTASSTNKSFSLAQNENSAIYGMRDYTGPIYAVWDVDGTGFAHVTEW